MRLGVYGCGYLGNVVAACLSDFGLPVTCFDEDADRVTAVAHGSLPFHERNLDEVVRRNARAGRLVYSTDVSQGAARSQIVYLGFDSHEGFEERGVQTARWMTRGSLMVLATPVPVGTARRLEVRLQAENLKVTVVSHPIFLTDGCAVEDFNWPDRILLGTTSADAVALLKQIYRPLVMRGVPVIVTNHETAELAREASTAFLATKISFINELASLCEHVNADAVDLALALGLDKRIAPRCLQPGAGFGGAFAEADMNSLAELADARGVSLKILDTAREVNRQHCERMAQKIDQAVQSLPGKDLGILGLAFKPNTNSAAASSSILLAHHLLARGAKVRAYDPVAMVQARHYLDERVLTCDSAYAAAQGADALVLSTGWPEFRALDFDKIKRLLKRPVIIDTKNLLDSTRLRSMGFQYVGVGRN
ncbi:MAG: UDP-glucose/GDP-mannose dehydrogenase family protein [Candidatus Korobacteraceae bacterium]